MSGVSATRTSRVQSALDEAGIDALIITTPSNIRYVTGFTGSNGTVVVRPDTVTLITDARYTQWSEDEVDAHDPSVDIEIAPGNGQSTLSELVASSERIGLESNDVPWSRALSLGSMLGVDRMVATSGVIEDLRELKDEHEIAQLRAAANVADLALASLIENLGPGPSEIDVARSLAGLMFEHGATVPSFDIIVASGPNAARPHHEPSERRLTAGDLLIIDSGAVMNGYRSDMTRSFILGAPNEQQQEMLDAVLVAQQAGVEAAGPGVSTSAIDDACRSSLAQSGLAQYFTHGTGHGVGLDIHEAPSVSSSSTATLSAGHIITVEPGVYIPEVGGVRWEDTIVINNSGAEVLTQSPKQPLIEL